MKSLHTQKQRREHIGQFIVAACRKKSMMVGMTRHTCRKKSMAMATRPTYRKKSMALGMTRPACKK